LVGDSQGGVDGLPVCGCLRLCLGCWRHHFAPGRRAFWLELAWFDSGVVNLGYAIGAAAGPLVAGYAFDTTGNYMIALVVSATIGFGGIILTALLTPTKRVEYPELPV